MNAKRTQLNNYKKFLLNRVTSSPHLIEYIEDCLSREDEAINYSFHKIMVHNWTGNNIQLYDTMADYYSSLLVPVQATSQGDIFTFYTSNLAFILKIIKFDFIFPYSRNMFNVDILFNEKTSLDFFENTITLEDIVTGVVSQRFKETHELDLSNFCADQEFADKKISFYKLVLVSHYKILMLRMGKDTKTLNLSNNHLSLPPIEILNFFIRGDLTAINLSYNDIPSMAELQRVSSKIEKLWLEGNPLCEELEPVAYIKTVVQKFPRLTELDGIPITQHGITMPFFRNYLCRPDKKTKMLVEKFITLFFAHFDLPLKIRLKRLEPFYDDNVILTLQTDLTDPKYNTLINHSRNIMDPQRKKFVETNNKCYNKTSLLGFYSQFMETVHDLTTFSVDVLLHNAKSLVVVVDGVFKEKVPVELKQNVFQFRRTFVFTIYTMQDLSVYHIINEIFTLSFATKEQIDSSFKNPIRNLHGMALIDADPDDCEALVKIYQHMTQLKKSEAELRLKFHSWDIDVAIRDFLNDLKADKIPQEKFIDEDDFSDTSSLLDDVD